jgi:ABC-type molybdate transport system substrate-binding protein
MRPLPSLLVLATAAAAAAPAVTCAAAGPRDGALRVRATTAVAPCVEAAARAYEKKGGRAVVETGALGEATAADVLVGAAAEVTRALESGAAAPDSDAEVARVPWVLVVTTGNPYGVHNLADAARAGIEVWVAGGPAAHAARRAAFAAAPDRVREASDGVAPAGAAAALAPLCLAGAGERVPVDVPELVVEAAVSARTSQARAAGDFVTFLASPAGRRAFAPGP